jgi:hypothetical protein
MYAEFFFYVEPVNTAGPYLLSVIVQQVMPIARLSVLRHLELNTAGRVASWVVIQQ